MTVNEFALATGYNPVYIQQKCREGKIPCSWSGGVYNISPNYVPVWSAKKNKKFHKGGYTIHNSVSMYQRAVDEYNRVNGTDLSYGQAVMLGVITDE